MPWDHLVFLPEGIIALQHEMTNGLHPKLMEILQSLQGIKDDDWEIKLAQVALYCGIVVEGVYGPDQINELAALCAGRLELLREFPKSEEIRPLQ